MRQAGRLQGIQIVGCSESRASVRHHRFDRINVEGRDLLGIEIRVGTRHGTVSIPGTLYSPRTARASVSTWVSRSPAPSRTTSAFSGAS